MKLHELVEGVTYIGEDGDEYELLDNSLCRIVLGVKYVVTKMSVLTQNFTPKKVERTVEEVKWYSVAAWKKTERHPFIPVHLFASEEEFLSLFSTSKEDYHWIKLIPVCKTQGNKLVEVE